jgi:hypothetical protein
MRKKAERPHEDDLRAEYGASHFRGGIRGKYVDRYKAGTNLVLLAPDVAAAFPTAQAVNEALRLLMNIAKTSLDQPARSRRTR